LLRARDLSASAEDRAVLGAFYDELYRPEFPDPDERESLSNIERYLALKAQGWYGANNYHVVLFFDEAGRCVAGSIFDYLAGPNAGVIEFLVVARRQRGRGLGTRVLERTERVIADDARQRAGVPPACVVAEINDPCLAGGAEDSLDPFVRARIWSRWGYRRLDFPYIQPALSPTQRPVRHLMLAIKSIAPEYRRRVPAPLVAHIVREYMRWAMRIPEPERAAEYLEMRATLDAAGAVTVAPFARVLAPRESRALAVREITGPHDPDLEPLRAVYRAAFTDPAVAVPAEVLGAHPTADERHHGGHRHLWAVRRDPAEPVDGMVSFVTFPRMGFGGYLAFGAALRGRGYLRPLVARVEEQMVRDCSAVRGWLVECAPGPAATRFESVGFHEVPAPYRQPALHRGGGAGPSLRLLYRELGDDGDAELAADDLLDALTLIFRGVYGLDEPRRSPLYGEIEGAVRTWPGGLARWPDRARS
jgi:GNAT superfamily N-acetyltransferase